MEIWPLGVRLLLLRKSKNEVEISAIEGNLKLSNVKASFMMKSVILKGFVCGRMFVPMTKENQDYSSPRVPPVKSDMGKNFSLCPYHNMRREKRPPAPVRDERPKG